MIEGWWLAALLVLVVLVVVQAILNLALFRIVGVVLMRLGPNYARAFSDLPWGETPPVELLRMADGSEVNLASGRHLITFVSPTCGICERLGPALKSLDDFYPGTSMTVSVAGDTAAARSWGAEHGFDLGAVCATQDQHPEFADGITSPYAVMIEPEGLHHGIVNDREMIESLLAAAA